MTPFWIWSLGRFYTEGNPRVTIPVRNVMMTLAAMVVPVSIGILINHFRPAWGKKLAWCLKPLIALVGILFMVFGYFTFYPIVIRASWNTVVACIILPILGYICGYLAGKFIVRDTKKAATISLETGFQNMALAMLMLNVSLPSPESDLAGVIPLLYSCLCPIAPMIVFGFLILLNYFKTGQLSSPLSNSDSDHIPVKTEEPEDNSNNKAV